MMEEPLYTFKHCPICNQDLPLSMFSRNRTQRDGRQMTCKTCHAQEILAWQRKFANKTEREKKLRKMLEFVSGQELISEIVDITMRY